MKGTNKKWWIVKVMIVYTDHINQIQICIKEDRQLAMSHVAIASLNLSTYSI